MTSNNGLPVSLHRSLAKNCSPVRLNNLGPSNAAIVDKNPGYLTIPICGVATVVKFTGFTVSKNLRWWRTPTRKRATSPPRE